MSCDKLVFDLSQEIEGSPNVFVKKDWLNILDNQNQNYSSNQSVIDTSQLSNSNKYLSYRESYFLLPMMLTLSTQNGVFTPATGGTSSDYAMGLKNWFGSIIHSFTLDYMGTTIIQQTPFINMWNTFKLMTSLSWNDIITQGSTIGFYPDDPLSWGYNDPQVANSRNGAGTLNNLTTAPASGVMQANPLTSFNTYTATNGNIGFTKRIQYINFDINATPNGLIPYSDFLPQVSVNNLWKSYIYNKSNLNNSGLLQIAVSATVIFKTSSLIFCNVSSVKGGFHENDDESE